jgi:hypothetical protein
MSEILCLHDKKEVESFCRRNPFLHLYSLGDLDDFFWPHTNWVALRQAGEVRQLVLVYTDPTMRMPTVLALAEPPESLMRELLDAWLPVLPRRFYKKLGFERIADYGEYTVWHGETESRRPPGPREQAQSGDEP